LSERLRKERNLACCGYLTDRNWREMNTFWCERNVPVFNEGSKERSKKEKREDGA